MAIYLVRLRCDSIRANLEGEPREYAFLKNVFVRATSIDDATRRALTIVRAALLKQPSIDRTDAAAAKLLVDEIRENQGFLRLFERHGFIFAPAEK